MTCGCVLLTITAPLQGIQICRQISKPCRVFCSWRMVVQGHDGSVDTSRREYCSTYSSTYPARPSTNWTILARLVHLQVLGQPERFFYPSGGQPRLKTQGTQKCASLSSHSACYSTYPCDTQARQVPQSVESFYSTYRNQTCWSSCHEHAVSRTPHERGNAGGARNHHHHEQGIDSGR